MPKLRMAELFADDAISELACDVEVAKVARVFLEKVKEDPHQGRALYLGRDSTAEGRGLVFKSGRGHDVAGACALYLEECRDVFQGFIARDQPLPTPSRYITPGLFDVFASEAPLQPSQLHVSQVLEESERGPTRWQATVPQIGVRQPLQFTKDRITVEIEISGQQLDRTGERHCRLCGATYVFSHLPQR
jgi:hypothetical protein